MRWLNNCWGVKRGCSSSSPDDPRHDFVTKRAEYAQAGIPEYGIVDPQAETVTILQLAGDHYRVHGSFGRDTVAVSATYAGLQAAVSEVLDAP